MKLTTKSGFVCEINKEDLDDMELLEDIGAVQDGNTFKVPSVIRRMLGDEQKKALYDHLRNDAGRVPTEAVYDTMGEIFELINKDDESKNL